MHPQIHDLAFTPAADLPGIERFKLSLGNSSSDLYHIKIYGDLIREGAPRTVLYAFVGDYCIARICPRHEIVGLTKRLSGRRDGGMGHFIDWIPVFGIPENFSIRLYADDMGRFNLTNNIHQGKSLDSAVYLGEITGRKRYLNSAPSMYTPLRLSCFGRSGSSLMMRYLSFHPQIAVAGQHPYEFTVAAYYYDNCRLKCFNAQDFFVDQLNKTRWRNQNPWYQYEQVSWMGGDAEQFFGRDQTCREIEHCRLSVDGFYGGVKPAVDDAPMFFCEKDGSGRAGHDEYAEVWPGARRLFLIRDFRDNCASILAYCRRKGSREFGLQYFETESDWLKTLAGKARRLLDRYQSADSLSSFVFYEQLVSDEQAALVAVLESLGLDSRPEVVTQVVGKARQLDQTSVVSQHATSGSAEQSIGRWREDLPGDLCRQIEDEFSEVMAGFGYAA